MRARHWGLAFVFLVLVALPLAVAGAYLWTRAVDQYASVVGFTVRQEDATSGLIPTELTGILGGGGGSSDTDILYEFIQSQSLVAEIDRALDLRGIYAAPHGVDPVFALKPEASTEELTEYWQRMVRLSYDQSTGLMELRVLAFDPDSAQTVARAIVDESQRLINDLNATARSDTLRYATEDLAAAEERLRDAREALVLFRTRTQIVDPETDAEGQTSLINILQQQLAQALIDYDLLLQTTSVSDPRVTQADSRIEAIRSRIGDERETSVTGEDYPRLLADYESLVVDREFAEESYRAARGALDQARANASRQTRYLAAYVPPTLPQTAEYPRRLMLFGLAALFLFLSWAILTLIYYSIRDTR